MMEALRIILFISSLAAAVSAGPTARINGGLPVDTTRRFPHHVTIHTTTVHSRVRYCSGSIIGDQWILTSIGCLYQGQEFRLDFNRLFINKTIGSFSVVVDRAFVFEYPTGYDDVAIVKIPLKLQFDSTIAPIPLSGGEEDDTTKLVVMPGFNSYSDKLTYGMFQIVPNESCQSIYGDKFDTYLQICSRGWSNNKHTPCEGNQGGGLVVNWPNNPTLMGIFSLPLTCDNSQPAVYMRVSKYREWILSVTGNLNVETTTKTPPFIPTTVRPSTTTAAPPPPADTSTEQTTGSATPEP